MLDQIDSEYLKNKFFQEINDNQPDNFTNENDNMSN